MIYWWSPITLSIKTKIDLVRTTVWVEKHKCPNRIELVRCTSFHTVRMLHWISINRVTIHRHTIAMPVKSRVVAAMWITAPRNDHQKQNHSCRRDASRTSVQCQTPNVISLDRENSNNWAMFLAHSRHSRRSNRRNYCEEDRWISAKNLVDTEKLSILAVFVHAAQLVKMTKLKQGECTVEHCWKRLKLINFFPLHSTVVRWHSFQSGDRPDHIFKKCQTPKAQEIDGIPLASMSCGQLQVVRKLALVTLTGYMERYCPTHRSGWNWELPKFIKKIKSPDYKGKKFAIIQMCATQLFPQSRRPNV